MIIQERRKKLIIRSADLGNAGMRGMDFEKEIMLVAKEYWRRKIAYIQKFEVPKGYRKTPGGDKIFFKSKTGYDFIGSRFYGPNNQYARSLFIEAKSNKTKSGLPFLLPTDPDQFGVKYHQFEALCDLERLGAESYILFRNREGVYIARALALRKLNPYGRSIFPIEHSDIWMEVKKVQGVWLDFLNALQ